MYKKLLVITTAFNFAHINVHATNDLAQLSNNTLLDVVGGDNEKSQQKPQDKGKENSSAEKPTIINAAPQPTEPNVPPSVDSTVNEKTNNTRLQDAAEAVVNLNVTQVSHHDVYNPFGDDPFMSFFFGGMRSSPRTKMTQGSGSGVVISPDGIIVTCAHVVKDADKIKAAFNDGREYEIELLLRDEKNDLAFGRIKSPEKDFPYVKLQDDNTVHLAEHIYAIGNAFGLGQSVTAGIISATSRVLNGRILLQTDASVNPGNSGGALINRNGELVGVPNAILSRSGANHGIGFAIPLPIIKSRLHMVEKGIQTIERVWLGATVQTLNYGMVKALDGFDSKKFKGGAIVVKVEEKSAASKAGLKPEDVIIGMNGIMITSEPEYEFQEELAVKGDLATLNVWRSKMGYLELKVNVDDAIFEAVKKIQLTGAHYLKDHKVVKVTPSFAHSEDLPQKYINKIMIVEKPNRMTLSPVDIGDVILKSNGVEIESVDQLEKLLGESGRRLNLVIMRGNAIIQMTLG